MRHIFINDNNLKDQDIEYSVIRVKGLIINGNGEILLAHNNGTYQFPGGHREDDEALEDCLQREIKEEIGIDVNIENGPFMRIVTYDSNYFGSLKKVCNRIYYFVVHSDLLPNLSETNYDELERQTDFNLFYIALDELGEFLEDAIKDRSLDNNIGREMLLVLEEFNRLYGGVE